MMIRRRASTSLRSQGRRSAFCVISRPEVATPPAFDALPGAYSAFAAWKTSMASSVDGMFAPSATHLTPFFTSLFASSPSSSFCVAQGSATSTATAQGRMPRSK